MRHRQDKKIIKVLYEEPTHSLNVMNLELKTRSTYNELNRNVIILAQEKIVLDQKFIRVRHKYARVISLNMKESDTKKIIEVLKILGVIL